MNRAREGIDAAIAANPRDVVRRLGSLAGGLLLLAALGFLGLLLSPAAFAGGVVTNCSEAALRAALTGGGTVTFACDGTITLSSTITNSADAMLDGSGRQVTISGGGSVRAFYVRSNVNLTLSSLTIANGRSKEGAGIFNDGGRVELQHCAFVNNAALGSSGTAGNPGSNASGGAVYNLGVVSAFNCSFVFNAAFGGSAAVPASVGSGGAGGDGNGGALWNGGILTLSDCLLANNSAGGGAGANGGVSGAGGTGGQGNGSAIQNLGNLRLVGCLLASNNCLGGPGGMGGSGAYSAPWGIGGPGGPGGLGGSCNGAVLNSGQAVILNTTITANSALGAAGAAGGQGGGAFNQSSRTGDGGAGGAGGSGYGAILDLSGQCFLTNCTLALNLSTPGAGGAGGMPGPWPYPYPPRVGSAGGNGASGNACALEGSGAILVNTLLASNTPANWAGSIVDAGHNLSSDLSPGLTGTGSVTNTDPKLGPLTNNGGPTLTMALLPGSPAIDGGDTAAAPVMDQRGFPRPSGAAADMGAFEHGSTLPLLSIILSSPTVLTIQVQGNSNQACRLLASSNLVAWVSMATNQIGVNGTVQFHDDCASSGGGRWYRVAMP